MALPTVQPPTLCVKAAPGESQTAHITIVAPPADAGLTASIAGGDSRVTLEHLIAYERVQRPFSEEEIAELPPAPPSIRQKARQHGITELQEIGRTDGVAPLAVPAGATVQAQMAFVAPHGQEMGVIAATLIVEGARWARVEVPVLFLVGPPGVVAAFEPASVRRGAEPGETLVQDVVIGKAPAAAAVVVLVAGGGSIIRVEHAIAFRPVRKKFTEDEIAELPPHPPEIRQNARANGYVEYQETGRTDGSTPLPVLAGGMLRVYVEFAAPEHQPPDAVAAMLVIEATTWQRIEVPLYLVIGKIAVTLAPESLAVRQGQSGDVQATLTSLAGPDTGVVLALGQDGGTWSVVPPVVHVARGTTVTAPLKVAVSPQAPLGTYPVGLETRSFEQLLFRAFPFELTVRPGVVIVTALQASLAVLQGDQAQCEVQVIAQGGYKRLTFAAGVLPPGVGLTAPVWEIYGAATTVLKLVFSVDPQARPIANARVTVDWSAGDGEHAGRLELTFTVLLRLETRTFSQPVITPAGTALGGHVELVLRNDGTGAFRGHMRATGLPSYKFRVRAVVRSANGRTAVAAQKSGEVFGTLESGDRQLDWDEPAPSPFTGTAWPDIRMGAMVVNKSYEMSGVLGTLVDVLGDVLEFVVAAALLSPIAGGPALAGLVFLGSELGALAGVRVVGPGGLVGLAAAGGAVFLLGPGMIIPVFVGGVLIGNLLVKHRALSEAEKTFAAQVFGDTQPTASSSRTCPARPGRSSPPRTWMARSSSTWASGSTTR